MLRVCIPVLNRYDTLISLLESIEYESTVIPDQYLIMDNGGLLYLHMSNIDENIHKKMNIHGYNKNIGVAASWNFFIKETWDDGLRIITNDDLKFNKDTIKNLLDKKEDIVFIKEGEYQNLYSLFLIRNSCVEKVGYFDETISPGYAYFEDNDYQYRIYQSDVKWQTIEDNISHVGSATLKNFSKKELENHHNKFKLARANYIKKWGGIPEHETYKTPYNE